MQVSLSVPASPASVSQARLFDGGRGFAWGASADISRGRGCFTYTAEQLPQSAGQGFVTAFAKEPGVGEFGVSDEGKLWVDCECELQCPVSSLAFGLIAMIRLWVIAPWSIPQRTSGCALVFRESFVSPLLQEPAACGGLPMQQAIAQWWTGGIAPTGTIAKRNDTASTPDMIILATIITDAKLGGEGELSCIGNVGLSEFCGGSDFD